ncbi:MAG: hypothetical protein H0V31_00975 [Acidobacteria bacterium]|nr:hypothetical protein [Acidobacteriota bacterium]
MINKRLLTIGGTLILSAALTGVTVAQNITSPNAPMTLSCVVVAQDPSKSVSSTAPMTLSCVSQDTTAKTTTMTTTTKQQVVQNPDGSYSVIEYPVGKEVTVELTPTGGMTTSKGMARVMRTDDGTMVNLDLSGLDNSNYFAYAVDPLGKATLLGPVIAENGMSKASFKTPLNQFMLVLSPTEGLTTVANDTPVVFRSAVPKGYAVVQNRPTVPTGDDKQVAGSRAISSTYNVPLLGVPGFEKGETEVRINFSGGLQGLKGKAYIDNSKGEVTKIKMRFDDMKLAPKDKRFVLWASSSDGKYTKLGQVINTGERQESEIRSETALKDFGLFVTVEDADVLQPTGTVYSTFTGR